MEAMDASHLMDSNLSVLNLLSQKEEAGLPLQTGSSAANEWWQYTKLYVKLGRNRAEIFRPGIGFKQHTTCFPLMRITL